MQKTKLGISVGLMGAAVYLSALFGGYTPLFLMAGYILLFEENSWLKKSAIKAAIIVFSFALLSALIGFIPGAIGLIDDLLKIFNNNFSLPVITRIVTLTNTVLSLAQKIILIVLAIKALTQGSLPIGFADNLVAKHTDGGSPMADGTVCSSCGMVMPRNTAFCVKCGNKIDL